MKIFWFLCFVYFFAIGCTRETNTINNQETFSFKLVFQDAIGNTDTLVLGFDENATDSVDIKFNETNIISTEIDPVFDVRITDEWISRDPINKSVSSFHLKKQIIKANCGSWPNPICIDIKCKNWPVTASWDNSLFNFYCRDGSVLTSVPPGGWWDVGSISNLGRVELKDQNQVTFTANCDVNYVNESYAYINASHDTISVFWVAFVNNSIFSGPQGIQNNHTISFLKENQY